MCDFEADCYICKEFDREATIDYSGFSEDKWPQDIFCSSLADWGNEGSFVYVPAMRSCEDYSPMTLVEQWQATMDAYRYLKGIA